VTLCRPLPYGLHTAPLEGGRRNPRKGYECLPRTRTGRRRDVGLVERVSSANSGPVRPSPPLYCHPGHCSAIPGAVGAQDDETLPRPLLCILQPFVILLTVYYRIKVHMDLQADKSTVVVKGPFFPRVVNPMYRIRGTMCNAMIQSSKARKAIY
jgi:hypothetical protein